MRDHPCDVWMLYTMFCPDLLKTGQSWGTKNRQTDLVLYILD